MQLLQQQEEERLRKDKAEREEKLKKPFQQLFVSSPDGLRVEYMNDSLYPSEGDMGGVIVRQSYPVKSQVSQGGGRVEQTPAAGEIWRTITTNGTVIKLLISGGVEVLVPDGAVSSCKTFPVQHLQPLSKPGSATGTKAPQDNVTTLPKKGGKGAIGTQTSVEDPTDTITELGKVSEWLSTGADGKRILTQSDGTHTTLDNILCSLATCRHTKQVLRMREDNVVMIDHPDSTRVVEHADGTRITTFYEDVQIETRVADNETGEQAHYTTEQVQFVKVERAGFATVTFQTNTGACVTTWGNETSMVTQADGSSVITKPDKSRLQIDKKGILSFVPRNVAQGKTFPLPVPLKDGSDVLAGIYVMRTAAQMCCEMTDERGCHFSVISNGHFTVQKPGDQTMDDAKTSGLDEHYTPPAGLSLDPYNFAKLKSNPETPLVPRYFIVHSDGTGLELLRGVDVIEFLEEAQKDPRCAVLQSPVEGYPGVTGLTILRPYSGGVSKRWKKDKDQANIIPSGLRERDFHSIPATEQKSSGPHFGTNIGLGLNVGSIKRKPSFQSPSITCPTVLELRQLLQYKPLTLEDRRVVTDVLQKYGNYVAERLKKSDSLLPQDPREESEKLAAEELNSKVAESNVKQGDEKVEEKGSCDDEISHECAKEAHDFQSYEQKYMDFVSPDPEPPVPSPKWKRPAHEWERDRIELAELHYGQHALRFQEVPPYFETAQGQAFLKGTYHQDVPDIASLTAKLAEQTRHPPPEVISRLETPQTHPTCHEVPSFSTENADYLAVEAAPSPSAVSATPNSLRPTNPTPAHADGTGTPTSLRPNNPTPGHASITANLRPTNPTPAKASGEHVFPTASPLESPQLKENLPSLQEVTTPPLQELTSDSAEPYNPEQARLCSSFEANVGAKSLYFDVTGQPRTSKVKLPTSILSGKPGALPNTRFMEVEDPVRRRVQTVSVTGGDQVTKEKISGLRGFELLPPKVGFGVLKEGCTYQSTVRLKNTGIDSCRFKVKQPPPSTGLKILCTPGSVAAGMSVPLTVEIFAVAVGVSGDSGVGQIGHHVEIITETDFLYLPVFATILTAYEFESRYGEELTGLGPGTIQVTNRPPSRDAIRPRRDESFHVST